MTRAGAMKERFGALDTLALARELRSLDRPWVDKAFDVVPTGYSITFRTRGEGRRELVLLPGVFGALLATSVPHEEEPSPWARELRRLLTGAVLAEVADPRGERMLELTFTRSDRPSPYRLIIELFGTGNIVVVDGTRIVAVARPRSWAHRSVRVGVEYSPPPRRPDPLSLSAEAIAEAFGSSTTSRVTTLAARLALGGPLAEELLSRAGVAGEVPASDAAADVAPLLQRSIVEILAEIGERPRGYLYRREAEMLDVEPFGARRWRSDSSVAEEARSTFSESVWEYFAPRLARPAVAAPKEDPRGELARQREQQRKAIAALEEEARQANQRADLIFANYGEAEKLQQSIDAHAGDPVEIVTIGGEPVPLHRGKSLRHSAQALYAEAKRAQTRLAGARASLEATEAKLLAVPEIAATAEPTPNPVVRRRTHWYERYRWFLSTEGIIVVAGRDAASNDLIVRKYLKAGDRYVHADIHGAASVVVKRPSTGTTEVGESTMREAGQWAVAYSKAWRAGLASANAFWVESDQVSKSAPSGEFVARGAWVIHGTKHILRDLPTELAIGEITVEGERKLTVAPAPAVARHGEVRYLLSPGEERDRPAREIELARALGVSRDRIQSLLPAGGISFRRT